MQAILHSAMGFAVLRSSGSCPAGFTNQGNLEEMQKKIKMFWVEEEGKEGIFLTFPCRAKTSITGKSTQACICKYMHTEVFFSTQKRFRSIRKLHTEPPQILAPVPNP